MYSRNSLETLPDLLAAQRLLIDSRGASDAINDALSLVGKAAEVDRVHVFEITRSTQGEELATRRYEWDSGDAETHYENLDLSAISLREAFHPRWVDALYAGNPVYGPLSSFPVEERAKLALQRIKSFLIVPIFSRGRLWGFVEFEYCTHERQLSEIEVDLLISVSVGLGIALGGLYNDTEDRGIEGHIVFYLGLVRRMYEVHSPSISQTARTALLERTQARIRVLIQSYRYFSEHSAGVHPVALSDYLKRLTPLLELLLEAPTRIVSEQEESEGKEIAYQIELTKEHALYIAVTLVEVFAMLARKHSNRIEGETLLVRLQCTRERGIMSLTRATPAREPVSGGVPLDAMAHALLRRIQDRMCATIDPYRDRAALFRLVFLLH